jgi:hypothetical protein
MSGKREDLLIVPTSGMAPEAPATGRRRNGLAITVQRGPQSNARAALQ